MPVFSWGKSTTWLHSINNCMAHRLTTAQTTCCHACCSVWMREVTHDPWCGKPRIRVKIMARVRVRLALICTVCSVVKMVCMDRQLSHLAMRKLSIHLSVKCVDCDKTEERSVQIFTPHERSFSLVFWEEEWLVEATPST